MSVVGTITKSQDDRRDVDVAFGEWLPEGDTIQDATAESSSEELVVETVQLFEDTVKVWISGGAAGGSYTVTVFVTTAGGRIKSACVRVRVAGCC